MMTPVYNLFVFVLFAQIFGESIKDEIERGMAISVDNFFIFVLFALEAFGRSIENAIERDMATPVYSFFMFVLFAQAFGGSIKDEIERGMATSVDNFFILKFVLFALGAFGRSIENAIERDMATPVYSIFVFVLFAQAFEGSIRLLAVVSLCPPTKGYQKFIRCLSSSCERTALLKLSEPPPAPETVHKDYLKNIDSNNNNSVNPRGGAGVKYL